VNKRAVSASPTAKAEPSRSVSGGVRPPPSKVHAPPGPAPFSITSRLQGGSPLPAALRLRMEHSFGRSFDHVRVHTGATADSVTREHRAEALTVGPHIAFGAGRFRPDTDSGQHLVAHELAHVAQQANSSGGVAAHQARSIDSVPGEPAEVAAESAAFQAARGERVHLGSAPYSIQNRVMRRALATPPPPPPNPAPLRARLKPPPKAVKPKPAALKAPAEAPQLKPDLVAKIVAARAPEAEAQPQPATGQGEARAQEQTEESREAAKEAIEEMAPAEPAPEAGAAVPELAGGAAGAAAPAAVAENPSVAETDKKEEAQAEAEGEQAGEKAKTEEGGEEEKPKQRTPASPGEDPAFQRVLVRGRAVASQQAHNNTAKRKAAEAQAAAMGPANEVEAMAGANQVGKMAEQQPAPFDKEGFKSALIEKINQIAPGTLDDADKFKSRGTAGQLKSAVVGQVEAGKEGAQGPIKQTAEEPPSTAGVEPKPVVPQPPTEAGPPPPDIGATAAAPKPKTDAEVNLDAGPKSIEDKMAEAKVTDETLMNSNEPEFVAAVAAKDEARANAETAPATYRETESAMVQKAQGEAAGTAQTQTDAMYDSRNQQFSSVQSEQDSTKTGDEGKRAEVTGHIQSIFDDTRTKVQDRLKTLDGDVNAEFDSGAETARQSFENEVEQRKEAYKAERYSGLDGKVLWVADLFTGLPDEINEVYKIARQNYIDAMSGVIDRVAGIVETGLNEAMGMIQTGRDSVLTYVEGLDGDLRKIGEDAAANIQSQFDTLAEDVKNAERGLVDSLAQKYVDNLKGIDDLIDKYKQDDKGLVDKAMEAVQGVIDTILQLKEMLMGILAKAAGVIDAIVADPIGFLGNLVTGIKMGLSAFLGNIGEHLKSGLMGWLFGAVASAGIQMPESFDLKGLLSLGAQILGLTYQNFRARAVKIVGEPIVKAMETAVEIFQILMTQGLGGVWTYIKDMLGNLTEMVMSGIRDWVATKVITAGITWLLSMLNPASAFVRACKMIIDVVMFFIERGSQIMSLVNAVLDSIAAIASGSLGAMASAVEGALAKAVPVAISFLASLLGLGGISDVIRTNIEKIQAPVNKAIDWLINKAVKLAKSIAGLFGGKKKKEDEKTPETNDPEHDAKVTAGLAAFDQEESKYLEDGAITREKAMSVAASVKGKHPVFKSITVIDGGKTWDYDYLASPGTTKTGEQQSEDNKPISGISFGARPGFRSSTREEMPLSAGEDRRHIVAWDALHESLKQEINGKTVKEAAALLAGRGYAPNPETEAGIKAVGRSYLIDKHNDQTNLWAGPGAPNQLLGSQAGAAKKRVYDAIAIGDRALFDQNIAILQATWHDPDPSGGKTGFSATLAVTILGLKKQFNDKWGTP
jgi:uncharacterized protein DUF4157